MPKQYITWTEIQSLSHQVAQQIATLATPKTPITLVAVSRGGLIPAQLIAYELNIRDIRLIKLSSYDENNQRGSITDFSTDRIEDGENVFFIDDLADSGATVRYIQNKFPQSKVCTLLSKQPNTALPDICPKTDTPADTWIVFPWD